MELKREIVSTDDLEEIICTAIVEEGWTCEHTNDDGPSIVVGVDGLVARLVKDLVAKP